jgi:putative membrane protein
MPHHHSTSGSWEMSVLLTLAIVFVALAYLRGWLHLRSTDGRIPARRAASFLGGLLLIWIAVASPMAALDHQLLTIHMLQHLLLMTLAPPLVWLGEPLMAFATGLPRATVSVLQIRSPLIQNLGSVVTQPAFCLFAASAALVGWHIPGAFALGMNSGAWHLVQQTTFLATGFLFWWPVIHPWPSVSRPELATILYLFFATLPCDILSGFLVFCDRVVYPDYLSSSHFFGFSALGDQQCAGALMWTCVTIVYLVAGTFLTMRLLSPENRATDSLAQSGGHTRATPLTQRRVEAL